MTIGTRPLTTDAGGQGAPASWDEFVSWAQRFYAEPDFEPNERSYKTVVADHLRTAQEALGASSPVWLEKLQGAFGSPNNLTSWQMHDKFLQWAKASPEEAAGALAVIWSPDKARIGGFLSRLPETVIGGRGSRLSLASFLQMAIDEYQLPFFKPTPASHAYRMAGYPAPDKAAAEQPMYDHFVQFLDTFIAQARDRGLAIRDRLDAQGLLWCLASYEPLAGWSSDDRD